MGFKSIKLDLNRLRRALRRLSPGGSLSVSEMTSDNAEVVTSALEKTRDAIYLSLGRRLDDLRFMIHDERVPINNLKAQVREIKCQLWKLQNQHRARSGELSGEHANRRRSSAP